MAKIAMFLARSPGAPMTGRKAVIHSTITALAEQGHDVDLFVVARAETGPCPASARRIVWLGTPSKARLLRNAAACLCTRRYSLNEALFRSERLLARTRASRHRYDFAIADTIRTAPYADALGVPWHLDLDDLFSARYEKYLEQPEELSPGLLLGYYRDSVPRLFSALPKAALKHLLKTEAALLRRREVYWARRASTVSLVSPEEAEKFAGIARRPVHSVPMSIRIPAACWKPRPPSAANGVFIGGLDYKPNLDALLYYQQDVFPLLKALPGVNARLDHIGNAPNHLRARFSPEVVSFSGYVQDLLPALTGAAYFMAPIVSGTGIKTKILEAMAIGLPVIATTQAMSGLKVEHRKHCFIWKRPSDLAEGMQLASDPGVAEQIGLTGRRYVEANFSSDAIRHRWRQVLHDLGSHGRCSIA